MNGGGRRLTPEEEALWRRVARDVARSRGGVVTIDAPSPAPARAADPPPLLNAPAPGPRRSAGPLADRGGEKRVRRGRLDVALRIDLHGMTQERAHRALLTFLRRAHQSGARLTLVITGKGGMGAEGRGVLRRLLPEWLATPAFRALVSGYAAAHARHGGAGAFYVFLRARDCI